MKISQRNQIPSGIVNPDDVLGIYRPGSPNTDYRIQVQELLSGNIQPINDPATPIGSDDTTTAYLNYGINIVRSSGYPDFCFRLPQAPQKGKSVIVINLSSAKVRVFPSVTGGDINGVVNGYEDVLPDKEPHTFFCWENPLHGSWSVLGTKTSLLTFPDVTVSHTNGAQSLLYWDGTTTSTGVGLGLAGTPYHIVLTGSWRSENIQSTGVKLRVYTNIIANDAAQDFNGNANGIVAWIDQGYQDSSNSATFGQRTTIIFYKTAGALSGSGYGNTYAINGGTLNSPVAIGDIGTFWGEEYFPIVGSGINDQLGIGGTYSRYYYVFGMQVSAPCTTKDYKFRFEIEYV